MPCKSPKVVNPLLIALSDMPRLTLDIHAIITLKEDIC